MRLLNGCLLSGFFISLSMTCYNVRQSTDTCLNIDKVLDYHNKCKNDQFVLNDKEVWGLVIIQKFVLRFHLRWS